MQPTTDHAQVRHHCIISGTGRAGTSFLVALLTRCGVDTGFGEERLALNNRARAGLEDDVRRDTASYLVKSPWFCDYADEVYARPDIVIDHVFVPMRNLEHAALSRARVSAEAKPELALRTRLKLWARRRGPVVPGGLLYARSAEQQEVVLLRQLYRLLLSSSQVDVPVTLLHFPTLAEDPEYLFGKLAPLLDGVDYEDFVRVFEQTVRPDLITDFSSG
ncbi:MAG: hypothetical protein AAF480_13520 [Actinomycetota bacterium]